LRSDGASRENVISGAHLDSNTSTMALEDSVADTITEGVFNTSDTNECQVLG
jgi:hypothetical protein